MGRTRIKLTIRVHAAVAKLSSIASRELRGFTCALERVGGG